MNSSYKIYIQKRSLVLGIILLISATPLLKAEDDSNWPKIIKDTECELTVYQPQPESLNGTYLSLRTAVSILLKDSRLPVFGAVWITSSLDVDRDTRIATLTNIKVPAIRFSDDVDSTGIVKLRKLISDEILKWDFQVSIDELISTLESTENASKDQFQNDPPEIIFANKPSILILIDGEPILRDLEGFNYKRVQNSVFFIINDPKTKQYYLYGDNVWYSASDIYGIWSQVKYPSSDLYKLQEEIGKAKTEQNEYQPSAETKTANVIPSVIIRTTPAELIVINGEPDFASIQGTDLLYIKNSENDVFMDIKSQSYFILLSGRWYTSKTTDGLWAFCDAEKLPEDFSKIPEGSEKDNVLASVPGINASREAILDNQIPQTAEIDRATATVTVEYDGEPIFEKVEGTTMLYAVNSPQTVLKLANSFYCVDNGVWFQSNNSKGPWEVAEKRPEEVDKIEPRSPVYNVKFVYILDVTPTVVYVGYTPGYFGSYLYGSTIIYGTGYYYRPWYGAYYYPRPVTYGFRMAYNPWTGWGISAGVSYGTWFYPVYGGRYHGGYWGPPGYRPAYHYYRRGRYYGPAGRPVYYNNINVNIRNNNLYARNRQGVRPSTFDLSNGNIAGRRPAPATQGKNNIYTDKNGKVYQKTNNGWQSRQGNKWKPVDNKPATSGSARPSTGSVAKPGSDAASRPSTGSSSRPSTGNTARPPTVTPTQPAFDRNSMDKASQSRNRGATRTNNYNNYSNGSRSPVQRNSPSSNPGRR